MRHRGQSFTACNAALTAKSKMAARVWKGVYLLVIGRSKQISPNRFRPPTATPTVRANRKYKIVKDQRENFFARVNYSQFMSEGEGFIKSLFFLNSKQTILCLERGKGVQKIMDFFHFLWLFFSSNCIPKFPMVMRPMLTFLLCWNWC